MAREPILFRKAQEQGPDTIVFNQFSRGHCIFEILDNKAIFSCLNDSVIGKAKRHLSLSQQLTHSVQIHSFVACANRSIRWYKTKRPLYREPGGLKRHLTALRKAGLK